MKTIKKTYKVYEYSELSDEAKKKALYEWNKDGQNLFYLQSTLNDECAQILKKEGIKGDPKCLYSLSSSQGDGLMFEGQFTWKGYSVAISHSGRYYHSNSKTIDIVEANGGGFQATDGVYDEFESIYQSICKTLEKFGYDWIEEETSEAHFIDDCNANDWTFTKDGTMMNE